MRNHSETGFVRRARNSCRLGRGTWRVLLTAVTVAGALGVILPTRSAEPAVKVRDHQRYQLETTIKPGFTLAAVGDMINVRPVSQTPSFEPVGHLIKNADVAFGNLEGTILDPANLPTWVEAETGGGSLLLDPPVAADLKKIGFDLVARANNHAMDFGVVGMRSTTQAVERAGIVQAGVGMSQGDARAPAFLDTPYGRVGLISVAASFTPLSRSGPPTPGMPPRPGVNALRTTEYHLVTAAEMRVLKNLAEEQQQLREDQPVPETDLPHSMRAASGLLHPTPGTLKLFGVHYMVSDHHGYHFAMNQSDLQEILLNVEDAKKSSDFVIVSIHAHMPGNWDEVPADFMPVFAHDAIDAGADAVLAQGPHQLRGIEIYKGRPIFYSLGNFIFQEDIMQRMEYDLYEQFHLDPRTTSPVDLNGYYDELDFASPFLYQSVVAVMTFGPHGVTEIKLAPIDIHKDWRFADRGVPTLASPTMARTILERLQKLSRPFGTDIEIEGNVGIIQPSIAAAPPGQSKE